VSTFEGVIAIAGLALLTLVTRGFFFLTDREIPIPPRLVQGLRYAPLAALMAVIAPDVVMTQGQLISTWKDARLFAAATGVAYFFWRRSMLGTIVSGMVVMLAMRVGLGW
jgi:branched-subunit amino acid transport protein